MKKLIYCIMVYILFPLFSLFANNSELESIINLDLSLKELNSLEPGKFDSIKKSNKFIIIEGAVASITSIERTNNNLIVNIQIINGEWIGLDKVEGYTCIVTIKGKEWEKRFPERIGRNPDREVILLNSHVLVIGKLLRIDSNSLIPIIEAAYIRTL